MRLLRILLLGLALLETTGLGTAVAAVLEHVACENGTGDGCCADGCTDDGGCDECTCCFHLRPMVSPKAPSLASSTASSVSLETPMTAPRGEPREILHVPRHAA